MTRILAHSTALRTVGRIFDADGARSIVIQQSDNGLSVSWETADGASRSADYTWLELERLQRAHLERRATSGDGRAAQRQEPRDWGVLLRTLGQDLDESDAETSTITGDLTWLSTSWTQGGRFMTRQYSAGDLWEASRNRAGGQTSSTDRP
jgi:hypothetical protein